MTSATGNDLTNAVRVNCSVSQKIHNRPIFESVTIPDRAVKTLMEPWMLDGQSSQIARRIGTPLRAYVEHQHQRPSNVPMDWSYAIYLHMCCELGTEKDSGTWGCAPDCWSLNTPSDAYVIREDGKPLCPKFLEVLCAWCYQELMPKFAWAMEECYTVPVDNRKDVLALVTRESFEVYREKFEKEGKTADYTWDPNAKMMEEMLRKSEDDQISAIADIGQRLRLLSMPWPDSHALDKGGVDHVVEGWRGTIDLVPLNVLEHLAPIVSLEFKLDFRISIIQLTVTTMAKPTTQYCRKDSGIELDDSYEKTSFLTLPAEIRTQIWSLVFDPEQSYKDAFSCPRCTEEAPSALQEDYWASTYLQPLLTCRQFYQDAHLLAFSRTTFVIRNPYTVLDISGRINSTLRPAQISSLRSVAIISEARHFRQMHHWKTHAFGIPALRLEDMTIILHRSSYWHYLFDFNVMMTQMLRDFGGVKKICFVRGSDDEIGQGGEVWKERVVPSKDARLDVEAYDEVMAPMTEWLKKSMEVEEYDPDPMSRLGFV
ncbi:hypothetical protein E4T48_00851 [Aureobasidium sp. EXF-10727]|nr:hypothetical protein E4T48_00851 [Aureobasidium sp. EXF-10727]KAI4730600.1 hypothetical protein E4T49_01566 [Aureobasidium sp. EXF-10728]